MGQRPSCYTIAPNIQFFFSPWERLSWFELILLLIGVNSVLRSEGYPSASEIYLLYSLGDAMFTRHFFPSLIFFHSMQAALRNMSMKYTLLNFNITCFWWYTCFYFHLQYHPYFWLKECVRQVSTKYLNFYLSCQSQRGRHEGNAEIPSQLLYGFIQSLP